MRWSGQVWCVLLLALAFLLPACSKPPAAFRTSVVEKVEWGKDFVLTADTGKPLNTADYHGRLQVLFFGYTHCPDICAPTVAKLAQLNKELGADAARVQVFFISVDPQHDGPGQLKKFLAGFDPSFIGLTGSSKEVAAVAADHKVFFKAETNGTVNHSGMIFVKDTTGHMRLLMKDSTPVPDMLHDLRALLASS